MAEEEGSLTDKAQYAILRFAKYKGPEISNIEAHNERMKEKYASNPDVDLSRSKYNFHIVEPSDRYRKMSEALIKQYDCPRVRSDSVRIVETLITASHDFFAGMNMREVRAFFQHAVDFLKEELGEKTASSPPWFTWTKRRRTCMSLSSRSRRTDGSQQRRSSATEKA